MDSKILLDASAALELLFVRDKALLVEEIIEGYERVCVSFLTVHLIYHFSFKQNIEFEFIETFVSNLCILNMDDQTYKNALKIYKNSKNDFEDALQLACFAQSECDYFVTMDKSLYKQYHKDYKIIYLQ